MKTEVDLLIRNGTIYDGTGTPPFRGDVAVTGDSITGVGPLVGARGRIELDASGLAIAPGFINMLSWANESLIHDGRSQSDIRQGVTLEVLGEGHSMGPWNDELKQSQREQQGDIKYNIEWTTLGEYLNWLAQRGVSCNVASFVGATTVREHVVGFENRRPTADELDRMCTLVRQAMEEGALGVASALAYSPAAYAETDELIALAKVAAECHGLYISHIRNEGDNLLDAFGEFRAIVRAAGVHGEIYHIKACGKSNWSKLETLITRIEEARAEGLTITANMYPYHASASGLDGTMPPWVQEGGHRAWIERLKNPEIRARVAEQMRTPTTEWDNFYVSAGSPENILLVGFKSDKLKPLAGKSVAAVAKQRGTSPEETIMDLVVEDDSNVGAAFFSMSEANIRRKMRVPWVSFCSDAQSIATEGVFLSRRPHPRTYGAFARLLGHYVREEAIMPLEEAVRRITWLPAFNLRLPRRGRLAKGCAADIVVFDPATIQDRATFADPHQYAAGVQHVFVNGVQVLRNGEHTGAKPGRVARGPGWQAD
ncbi:MAG: D-aminoacylase [Phycisphaerae bacterium]|nr:D-aminoacylase [Phycisphaerae bacterium]